MCSSWNSLFVCSIPYFLISKGDIQKVGKDLFFLEAVLISCIPDAGIFWWCSTLFCGSVYNSSVGIGCHSSYILGGSQDRKWTDSITAQQEDRGVEPEQWKGERISCLDLDGFCFPIIQELLQPQLGDPDAGSTKSSPTNIFKKDVHKINIKGGKQHYCNSIWSFTCGNIEVFLSFLKLYSVCHKEIWRKRGG